MSSSIFRRFSSSARLGDLLVQAGILTPAQLQEAMRSSRSKKLQIGQVLVMSGYMTSRDLQIVLEAQSMLRDRTIDLNLAIQCIKVARKIGGNFSDVLEDYDQSAALRARTGKLGELLFEAGLISEEDLSEAMERSVNTGMPLGRMLVLNRILPSEVLQKALEVQVRLRDEVISREEAILSLRQAAGLEGSPTEQPKAEEKKKPVVRLGELLVMAGILTETDVMDALEWGLANQQPIGVVLVSQELISKELLDAALFFQNAVRDGKIDAMKACELLSEVFSTGISPEEALEEAAPDKRREEPEVPPISYQQLLTLSRVVTDEEIEQAFELKRHGAALIGKVLVLTGLMDVPTLQATLRCYQMVAKGWLTPDDAIATLDYCLHHGDNPISFEQGLRDLKWTPESGLKMRGEAASDSSTTLPKVDVEPAEAKEALTPAADKGPDVENKSADTAVEPAEVSNEKVAESNKSEPASEPTKSAETAIDAVPLPEVDDDDDDDDIVSPFALKSLLDRTLAEEEEAAKGNDAEETGEEKPAAEAKPAALTEPATEAEPAQTKEKPKGSLESLLARQLAAQGEDDEDDDAETANRAEPVAAKKQAEPASARSKKGGKEKEPVEAEENAQEEVLSNEAAAPVAAAESASKAEPEPVSTKEPVATAESVSTEQPVSAAETVSAAEAGVLESKNNGEQSSSEPATKAAANRSSRKRFAVEPDEDEDENDTQVVSSSEPSLARALNSLFDGGDDDEDTQHDTKAEPVESENSRDSDADAKSDDENSAGGLKNLLRGLVSEPEDGAESAEKPAEATKAEVLAGSASKRSGMGGVGGGSSGESKMSLKDIAARAAEIASNGESKKAAESVSDSQESSKNNAKEPVDGADKQDSAPSAGAEEKSGGEKSAEVTGEAESAEAKSKDAPAKDDAKKAEMPVADAKDDDAKSTAVKDVKEDVIPAVETAEEEEAVEDIAKLSAEQLLVEIMKTAQNPESHKATTKRGGRFSETILPEDAKARQLAKLVGKEASKDLAEKLAFDHSGEKSEEPVDTAFGRLAETYFEQGNYKEAQVIYERMLVNRLNELGPDNPLLVEDYNNLAMTLCVQGRFDKAEPFMKRAVHLYDSAPTQDPIELADYLHSLGTIEYKLEKHKDAEEIMLRVVSIRRESLEEDHEDIGRALADYAKVLKKLGKDESAEAIYKKAREILKKHREG